LRPGGKTATLAADGTHPAGQQVLLRRVPELLQYPALPLHNVIDCELEGPPAGTQRPLVREYVGGKGSGVAIRCSV